MKLKLKESPREWQKFTGVLCLMAALLTAVAIRRHWVAPGAWKPVAAILAVLIVTSLAKPFWFRGVYRVGMTASFHVGQVMGRILLSVFFLVVVTPLGWALRLSGKDLLNLRRAPPGASYWKPAKEGKVFDRMF